MTPRGAGAMAGRVLIVAGSDSGGGAGIQADIKTVTALGAYAMTAVTALTAQNTRGVFAIHDVPADFVAEQMRVVLSDIGADCVKVGMLHRPDVIAAVCDVLEAEAEAARIEIARRLLALDAVEASGQETGRAASAKTVMIGVAGCLPLLALGLYLVYGSPNLPDQPLASRLQDPASSDNPQALVARVEARLRAHPEEGDGWEVIAPVYMAWRRYNDAPSSWAYKYGPDLFEDVAPHHWMGKRRSVYCVDFSVGGRSEQRFAGDDESHCQLAALRVPEWRVVHDDGDDWDIGEPGPSGE